MHRVLRYISIWPYETISFLAVAIIIGFTANLFNVPQFQELLTGVLELDASLYSGNFWFRAISNTTIYLLFISTAYTFSYHSLRTSFNRDPFNGTILNSRYLSSCISASMALLIPASIVAAYFNITTNSTASSPAFMPPKLVSYVFIANQFLALILIIALVTIDLIRSHISWRIYIYSFNIGIVLFAFGLVLEVLLPIHWAQWCGPLPVLFVFMNGIICLTRLLSDFRWGWVNILLRGIIAYTFVLSLFFAAFKYFSLNLEVRKQAEVEIVPTIDNLRIGATVGSEHPSQRLPMDRTRSIRHEFRRWLRARNTSLALQGSQSKRRPVIVAAAQGGGIYTAYYAAFLLSALQDRCHDFNTRLFGISGVSGGAIGATVFASASDLFSEKRETDGKGFNRYRKFTSNVFEHDFLTPLVATFLYKDLPSMVLPFPFSSGDRSDTLQRSLEHALQSSAPMGHEIDALISRKLTQYWRSAADVPALFLNSTLVNNGWPVTFAPFSISEEFGRNGSGGDISSSSYVRMLDRPLFDNFSKSMPTMTVGEAAVASASFPVITPPFLVHGSHQVQSTGVAAHFQTVVKFTDGGFFDNSGAFVAGKVLKRLLQETVEYNIPQVKFVLFRINVEVAAETFPRAGPDLLLTTETLYRVRTFHQETIGEQIDSELLSFADSLGPYGQVEIVRATLKLKSDFILTWQLSRMSKIAIEKGVSSYVEGHNASEFLRSIGC